MLRSGVKFSVLMKLLGHVDPAMTMRYVDVALTDLEREFQLARPNPRHLSPQLKITATPVRAGLDGLIDSLIAAQHVIEMFRRSLPNGHVRNSLPRHTKRLTEILAEIKKLRTTSTKMEGEAAYGYLLLIEAESTSLDKCNQWVRSDLSGTAI
jgi:hypothetical protein